MPTSVIVRGFYRNLTSIVLKRQNLNWKTTRLLRTTPGLRKDDMKSQISELEKRFKKLISEYIDESSPLNELYKSWISKPWIKLFEQSSSAKEIEVKERKDTPGLKDGMFRMGFDLTGFGPQDIKVILSEQTNVLYIEAKKLETTTDGNKSWREISFECHLNSDVVNKDSIGAYLDTSGLLVIEGDAPKAHLSGVTKKK